MSGETIVKKAAVKAKKVGSPLISVRIPVEFLRRIEAWRELHRDEEVRERSIQQCLLILADGSLKREKL